VPEVDEVAAALDRTAQRLGELVARERAFSADASHQLRTPLQALRLELEGLQLRLAGAPAPELDAALEQVDRLQETIQVLLALARDRPRGAQRCDLREVLAGVRDRWNGPLAAVGRPLRVRESDDALIVQAGEGPIREIVEVLVANAEAHGAGTVTLTVGRSEGWVSLTVADEGAGFGPDPEQAFTRRGAGAEGHGIGLALARALAHAEGGRLSVARGGPHPEVTLTLPAGPGADGGSAS
jgi:signal transduction histidine kinase